MIMKVQSVEKDAAVQAGLSFFQTLLETYHPRDCDIRFWDGSTWQAEEASPARFTIVLNHPGALEKMFSPPIEMALGESYAGGHYTIEGDLEGAFRLADHLINHAPKLMARLNLGMELARLRSGQARFGAGLSPRRFFSPPRGRTRES